MEQCRRWSITASSFHLRKSAWLSTRFIVRSYCLCSAIVLTAQHWRLLKVVFLFCINITYYFSLQLLQFVLYLLTRSSRYTVGNQLTGGWSAYTERNWHFHSSNWNESGDCFFKRICRGQSGIANIGELNVS